MRRVKAWLVGVALMMAVVTTAHAILPVAGLIAWLTVGSAAESAAGLAASVAVNTGIIAAFALSFWKKDENNKPTGSAPTVTVYLNPSKARENPDPTKFDDPANGGRDVTPKATATGTRQSVNTPAGLPPPTLLYCFQTTCAASEAAACTAQPKPPDRDINGKSYSGSWGWQADGCAPTFKAKDGSGSLTLSPSRGQAKPNNTTACPGTGLTATGGKCPASNFPETGPVTCPDGYTAAADTTTCNLTDGAKVKKPDTQPCELLRTAGGGLEMDPRNPNCLLPEIQVQGNSVQADSQSISLNADGSVSVANPKGQTTFQIGSYNTDGSANITGITRSGNPNSYDTTSPSTGGGSGGGGGGGGTGGGGSTGGGSTGTSPVCGGVGQAACSGTGNSGGTCGGPGQPACTIDDSGFSGKGVSTAAAEAALDGYNTDRTTMLDNIRNGVVAPGFSWRPPVQNVACQPLEFGIFKGVRFSLNWCRYLPLMHDAISFLAYCLTALYLFSLLFSTSKKEAK